jgi:formyl-CoA transferase/CoA:oxalate CoA-transferase
MFAAYAIAAALAHRERAGKGEHIDVSLLDGQLAWLTYMSGYYFATGKDPERAGSRHPTIVPYQTFATADGYINVAAGNDEIFQRLCTAIGQPDLALDPRFHTNPKRVENRAQLEPLLEGVFTERTTGEWRDTLNEHGVPAGPVYRISEIVRDPQIVARQMTLTLRHPKAGEIRQFAKPFRVLDERGPATPPPLLGEHTAEVLGSLGYSEAQIADLRRSGVI